jgi:hypothetical protein
VVSDYVQVLAVGAHDDHAFGIADPQGVRGDSVENRLGVPGRLILLCH